MTLLKRHLSLQYPLCSQCELKCTLSHYVYIVKVHLACINVDIKHFILCLFGFLEAAKISEFSECIPNV